jgi:biopolymer transport protein ExbD
MSFSTSASGGLSTEINVTPLIDVLLVLLIIFMVIVPETSHGLDVEAPRPGNPAQAASSQAPVILAIRTSSDASSAVRYSVDGEAVAPEAVASQLRARLSARAERQVLLNAESSIAYGAVAAAVDWSRDAGAQTVGLMRGATKR